MSTSTRPHGPIDHAAARRNYVIFSIAAIIGLTAIVVAITLVLV